MEKDKPVTLNLNIVNNEPVFFVTQIITSSNQEGFTFTLNQRRPLYSDNGAVTQLIEIQKTVHITPMTAKSFSDILTKVIKQYEKQFGEIKLPKVEKSNSEVKTEITTDSYIS